MKVTNALEYILEIIVGIMLMLLILLSGFTELTTVRATNYWEHSFYDFEPRDVPRAEIEKIYNETGRRAVVVR